MDISAMEIKILQGLKDFQLATVERVFELFTNGYHRVLVADEVGLGKTMVAKGVIAKMARFHLEELKDPLFKVVYICSNQSIARQNLIKLSIDHVVEIEDASESRLSMQHLNIFENENQMRLRDRYLQLIALTPATSFDLKSGQGSVKERALIFNILQSSSLFRDILSQLELLMMDKATKSWDYYKTIFKERIYKCNMESEGRYLETVLQKVKRYLDDHPEVNDLVYEVCQKIKAEGEPGKRVEGAIYAINLLRKMMAIISTEMLEADLVIMDEFQRFPELLRSNSDSETAMLASKFFDTLKTDETKINILLLSATPYKLYSTLEEIVQSGTDDHYKEFMEVIDFLFKQHPEHNIHFKKVWKKYSMSLSQIEFEDWALLRARKQEAEDSLYKGIARTERMDEKGTEHFMEEKIKRLQITENDIISYIAMDNLLQETSGNFSVPVDYVKSAPFLMSYMEHYKLKQEIEKYFRDFPERVNLANKRLLWLRRAEIQKYRKLPQANAKFEMLKQETIPAGAEKLLWIPPSLPYYEFGGSFRKNSCFSKVLVFSAWAMVPRAVSTLLSYEVERLTVGKMIKKSPQKKNEPNRGYFAKNRYPQRRLTFNIRVNSPANMNHLTLLYPSLTLAKLFNPINALNKNQSLEEIKKDIKVQLKSLIDELPIKIDKIDLRDDDRWYWVVPLLLDRNEKVIEKWFTNDNLLFNDESNDNDEDRTGLVQHFDHMRTFYNSKETISLGQPPEGLIDVLCDMVLGSPSICIVRMLQTINIDILPYIVRLAKKMIDLFNSPEAISVVELEYGSKHPHWRNVLFYCIDGNVQAMFDEYAHMLLEERGLSYLKDEDRDRELLKTMTESINVHTASYNVDTYANFRNRVVNHKKDKPLKLRAHYAVGYADKRSQDASVNRKVNIRQSFNSPFWPFVLVSTSIGQEGLDFHYYCRKTVHWNLPSNPVDIEQREGRINRYKCFAIRQNIAKKYGNIQFHKDVWDEMFLKAKEIEKDDKSSELVPFWSLHDNQEIKIERIVPVYPYSRDEVKYRRLMEILSLYRLSLGQARQEELIEYLFRNKSLDDSKIEKLFLNLSPFYRGVKK